MNNERPRDLLAKVQKYRGLARMLADDVAAQRIYDLTVDLERQAERLAKLLHREEIRTRAHQIWQEHSCPPGRDDEFWLQAERELGKDPDSDEVPAPLRPLS